MKLKRITTEYISAEDRIRLSGDVEDGQPRVLWLTQRLLLRVLPPLLQWLEKQAGDTLRAEVLQGFAQQAAKAELVPQAPVESDAETVSWLVKSVGINQSSRSVRLTFKGVEGQEATLTLASKPLRQWLGIVHYAYLKAGWPLDMWPGWMRESNLPAGQRAVVLH